jgi:transposase
VVAKVARPFDIATSRVYKSRRQAVSRFEPAFTPALVIDNGVIPETGAPEIGTAVTPIRVELAGGARVNIEARAGCIGRGGAADAAMIPIGAGVKVWIATGHTDMRMGMRGLAPLVQEGLGRDPFAGEVFVFRGRSGSLLKCLWHDGIGLSLYAKRLERGRFIWPATVGGAVCLTRAQMGYLLEGIDWRHPQQSWRPELAG